jgi:hypothetical protein
MSSDDDIVCHEEILIISFVHSGHFDKFKDLVDQSLCNDYLGKVSKASILNVSCKIPNRLKFVRYLIVEKGFDINSVYNGHTPLKIACIHMNFCVIRLLNKEEADPIENLDAFLKNTYNDIHFYKCYLRDGDCECSDKIEMLKIILNENYFVKPSCKNK